MWDNIVGASEALRVQTASFIPAMKTCPTCGETYQIAAPMLGSCVKCGVEFTVGDDEARRHAAAGR